jgi:hypothetical protein
MLIKAGKEVVCVDARNSDGHLERGKRYVLRSDWDPDSHSLVDIKTGSSWRCWYAGRFKPVDTVPTTVVEVEPGMTHEYSSNGTVTMGGVDLQQLQADRYPASPMGTGQNPPKERPGRPAAAILPPYDHNPVQDVVAQSGKADPGSTGYKLDDGKIPCELLPPEALLATARVLQLGAKKYSNHNWRGGMRWTRIVGAILRHTFAFMMGEDIDKDSGLPHVDHLACEVMFLQVYYQTRKDLDDRYKAPAVTAGETKEGSK